MNKLNDAIVALEQLEKEYLTAIKVNLSLGKKEELVRLQMKREGVKHSIDVIKRMKDNKMEVMPA